MNAATQFLLDHLTAESATLSVLGVAAVCTMPPEPPGVFSYFFGQATWTWLRDTLQTAIPAARHPQITLPPSTQVPVDPTKEH